MAESLEDYRAYLFAIAYRMLGSAMDAEDMVQETYLRFQAMPPETQESIISLKAYLTTILTRLCMNQLQSAHHKREQYIGPWLPEPLSTDRASASANPEERVELHESLSLAFLVLLEELQPIERAVFLLHDIFDYEYAEISVFVGRSEAACRQALSRAKKHLTNRRPRFTTSPETQRQMLSSFLQAVQGGDMEGLMTLLADGVTLWADGGGRARGAATRPVHGPYAVARFVVASVRFVPGPFVSKITEVNGEPAVVLYSEGHPFVVVALTLHSQRIEEIRVIGNPEKLHHLSPLANRPPSVP